MPTFTCACAASLRKDNPAQPCSGNNVLPLASKTWSILRDGRGIGVTKLTFLLVIRLITSVCSRAVLQSSACYEMMYFVAFRKYQLNCCNATKTSCADPRYPYNSNYAALQHESCESLVTAQIVNFYLNFWRI